ncbi:hypothetical protein EON63_22305, partial [archaeon]
LSAALEERGADRRGEFRTGMDLHVFIFLRIVHIYLYAYHTHTQVYKGLNERTGELLAIKQLMLCDGSEKEVEELQKEITVMWELDHENIVRYKV